MKSVVADITIRQRREAAQATDEEIRPISWAWRNPPDKEMAPTVSWVPTGKSNRSAKSYWRALAKVYERRKHESAWPNGPVRVKGTGNGSPSHYVCGRCLRSSAVYRCLDQRFKGVETWFCAECRSGRRTLVINARTRRSSSDS